MLVNRYNNNPILKPKSIHSWEAQAVFNGCPVKTDEGVKLVYRALSLPHYSSLARTQLEVSSIAVAESHDGKDFHDRHRLILPEKEWEKFGVEDPRVSKLDDKYFVFYTALSVFPFGPDGIKVGVAISKDLNTIEEKHLVTPFNAKGMVLFPEKINGKIWGLLSVNTDKPPAKFCLVSFDKTEDIWNQEKWQEWYKNADSRALKLSRRPQDQVEVGAAPIKTKDGWLVIYSYISDFFTTKPVFGVEVALLDLEDPSKIIAKTEAPLMVPDEYYEKFGMVPNVIFPSGAFLEDNSINLYYGAVDTVCCLATIDYQCLMDKLLKAKGGKVVMFERPKDNPILEPNELRPWEGKAVLNPGAIYIDGKVHLVYRAMGEDNTSVMGYATSSDGYHIDYQSPEPIYVPREDFERKGQPNGNSGCEDPRLTLMEDRVYMLYTAYNGINPPRVAMTSISVKDFLSHNWEWSRPSLITPPEIADKDACLFPEKINDKYFFIHRSGDDIDSAFSPSLDFSNNNWLDEYRWIAPRKGMWDDKKVGLSATPFKTSKGWVLLYHGVSEENSVYRMGACLLDLDNPTQVIARLDKPIFEPKEDWELWGIIPNVVFPCGAVVIDETVFIYYGGGDKVIGVATIKIEELLTSLEFCRY
ncbi:MAG: hypothetical protein WCT01_05165 [Candidatus Shapirobacteria bacterium]